MAGVFPKLPKGISRIKWFVNEHPDIAVCFGFVAFGFATLGVIFKVYDKDTYQQHKDSYTVIREEDADPAVKEKGCYN